MKNLARVLAGSLNKYAVTSNANKNIRSEVKKKVAVDAAREGVSDHINSSGAYLKKQEEEEKQK